MANLEPMTAELYECHVQLLLEMAGSVRLLDLDQFLRELGIAEAAGPVVMPERYRRHARSVQELRRLAEAARELKRVADELVADAGGDALTKGVGGG